MRGRQVKSLDRLLQLSGGAVYVEAWKRPCSVAFLISMRLVTVSFIMNRGIYEYKAKGNLK